MDSLQLKSFNKWWNNRMIMMEDQHGEEITSCDSEANEQKKQTHDSAQVQIGDLRNSTRDPTDLYNQIRQIKEQRGAALRSIDDYYAERMNIIKESQSKEHEHHRKAYAQALADRSSLIDSTSPVQSSVVTPANTVDTTVIGETDGNLPTPISGDAISTVQTPKVQSVSASDNRMSPIQDMVPTPVASRESSQSAPPDKGFSATVQREFTAEGREQHIFRFKTKNRKALQGAIKAKQSTSEPNAMESIQTPVSTNLTTTNETAPVRTITFDEVYQNGQAKHKDTIVEFPPGRNQWYILKCEEHSVRFSNKLPIAGAAKHLSGRLHGGLERSYVLAIKTLGYRVVDCNEQLARQNNEVVNEAFRNGYKPISLINPENKKSRTRKSTEGAGKTPQKKSDNPNRERETNTIPQGASPLKARKNALKTSEEIITNPKPFHVYNCFWRPERCLYPVMILGWNDQTPGGLEYNLAGTGLLDRKKSNVPGCYVYKDVDSTTNGAIIGWSQGFEDGGPNIKRRKFPVMFLYVLSITHPYPLFFFQGIVLLEFNSSPSTDNKSNVSWVAAKDLSKFPLYQQDQPKRENEYYKAARSYIAKRDGYGSWEAFEAAQKANAGGVKFDAVTTPIVSPLTDVDDSNDDSDTDESMQSSISNVTEKELREMQETAGEIDGDDDYSGSDAGSTLSNENEWEQPEADGRPWAFYHLRKSDHASGNTNAQLSTHENHKLVYNQGNGSSGEGAPTLEPTFQDIYIEGVMETERDAKTSRSTPPPDLNIMSIVSQAASKEAACTSQADDINSKKNSSEPIARSETCFKSAPSPSVSPELIVIGERPKRARSEEMSGIGITTAGPDNVKKARMETEPPNNQARTSAVQQPISKPSAPTVHPTLLCIFEISSYRKGPISWVSGGPCLELHFQEDKKRVATVNAHLEIVIDPTTLRGFAKEEIPGSKGNSLLTVFPSDVTDDPVTVVFNRAEGSRKEIGKTQVRRFTFWLRDVVPSLPTLNCNVPNK
ncbi:hypothetical protein F5B22DRAFT_645161 [Xylaria bambusicola]|uniref:uncharacterized protein n=1 Tax=Xylaria bambusicola TaxID=326684 RepID=UPI00200745A5|nr:uncharacterized protein F5B22DRAFT_645161 [Xylaria bambusicola]KAI0517915.1 hypothetical protein F5B22DRAFT_645161 [Xylaria bambusicola]